MANAAAKKAAKAGESISAKLKYVIILSTLLFVIYRGYFKYEALRWLYFIFIFATSDNGRCSLWTVLGFFIHSACLIIAYFGMVECAKNNSSSEVYFDLLCVTIASQVIANFFEWGWYIMFLVPLYGAYFLYSSGALGALGKAAAPSREEATPEEPNKSSKEKAKTKFVRGR